MDANNPYNYPQKQENKTARFTCKCLMCKKVWTVNVVSSHTGWNFGKFYNSPKYTMQDNKVLSVCPFCGGMVKAKKIEGFVNPEHKCDSRCTGAKGGTCECSCGGENHGISHLIN
jgi:hypothetical protein